MSKSYYCVGGPLNGKLKKKGQAQGYYEYHMSGRWNWPWLTRPRQRVLLHNDIVFPEGQYFLKNMTAEKERRSGN